MAMIEDGEGTRRKAGVSGDQRLRTRSISEPLTDKAAASGDKFNINTGDITLTSGNESAVLYLENTNDQDIIMTATIYNFGSSDGTGDWKASVIRNPTAGTIIDNAVPVEMSSNMNFGSAKVIGDKSYKGAEGDTISGEKAIESRVSGGRVVVSLGAVVIPKGKSIAVTYTPPTGNTSAIVNCAIACYLLDMKEV